MQRWIAPLAVGLALGGAPVALGGCGPAESEYGMREWIEMGPFVFSVHRASDRLSAAAPGRPPIRTVSVQLRVDLDRSEPAKVKFDDFMNDMTDGRMIVFPAAELVDAEGQEFDGLVQRLSGKDRWKVDFELVVPREGMGSAERYRDRRASDFRVRIRNLDRRGGQPAVAVIALE